MSCAAYFAIANHLVAGVVRLLARAGLCRQHWSPEARSHWRHAHHFLAMSLLATAVYYFAFAKGTALLDTGIAGIFRD